MIGVWICGVLISAGVLLLFMDHSVLPMEDRAPFRERVSVYGRLIFFIGCFSLALIKLISSVWELFL